MVVQRCLHHSATRSLVTVHTVSRDTADHNLPTQGNDLMVATLLSATTITTTTTTQDHIPILGVRVNHQEDIGPRIRPVADRMRPVDMRPRRTLVRAGIDMGHHTCMDRRYLGRIVVARMGCMLRLCRREVMGDIGRVVVVISLCAVRLCEFFKA
jgi:hypothetical protein